MKGCPIWGDGDPFHCAVGTVLGQPGAQGKVPGRLFGRYEVRNPLIQPAAREALPGPATGVCRARR
jgi:hypothetical protein